MNSGKTYIAIDLKSFYASVECRERGLDPLTTNLVVADSSRTQKTICLAVTPSLKAYGVSGRARLFEVVSKVRDINKYRLSKAPDGVFKGKSSIDIELKENPSLELDYIIAPPRMAYYIEYSTIIYNIYLKYFSDEDIVVYSIDEVFIDVSEYLNTYGMTAKELAMTVISDVLKTTGITATAGIGENLYLCKIAMDVMAKHIKPDKDGVRIAELSEKSYRETLWTHTPITDFWRVGKGYAKKLAENGMYTMGDIARCSIGGRDDWYNEDLLYKLFGINAELLIDHAWGWEPCTIKDIKSYKPAAKSIGSGQVLHEPYTYELAMIVLKEMTESLVLDMVDKGFVTDQIVLTVAYDIENLTDPVRRTFYKGEITTDAYGRKIPKHAHGTHNFKEPTSLTSVIMDGMINLYERITDKSLLIRKLSISVNNLKDEKSIKPKEEFKQLSLFDDFSFNSNESDNNASEIKKDKDALEKEKKMQRLMIDVKKKFGKNAILKGMSLQEGATAKDRNKQIGGHKA